MICGACGHENRDQARFCEHCGRRLGEDPRCGDCGASLRAGAHFCDACGAAASGAPGTSSAADGDAPGRYTPREYTPRHLAEKILSQRSALEGERKQVTVLFADVKGSMELASQLDPEEWHRILDRYFEILTEGVHRFEGCVNQYTGDGIMALFGAPIACEDHAQRACYAALWLRDRLRDYSDELRLRGLNFSVRIGLNSGEVVVGRIGDDLRMDYTAQGHTVGLAQRMEQLAAPGNIVLAAGTARLVEPYCQLKSLGPLSVKGVGEPVEIFELEAPGAARSRLDASRSSGFSRFVGRVAEMQSLESALEASRGGDAIAVGVVGRAGVGKSRLCDEFVRRCRRRGLPVYEAHCLSHARSLPLHAFLELTRSYFGIVDRDSPAEARRKIAGTLVLLQSRFQESLPLLFDFMGVPDPERPAPVLRPEVRERAIVEFLRELVSERSRRESALVFVDDLHWIDPESDALLAELVTAALGTRTLLLFNFRPEYHATWTEGAGYRALPLAPLSEAEAARLLAELLGDDAGIAGLKERIAERAEGNPLFTEEIVRELVERGELTGERGAHRLSGAAREIEVPATVQAVLAARIDRLAEREKQLLQQAAVIGREFSEALLARVAGLPNDALSEVLARLCSLELIRQTAFYPEAEYQFQHPLTNEVAYRTQLTEARARIHGSVARAMEELGGDRVDERAALIAQHLDRAGEAFEAARWYLRAGELNRQVSAGMRHWRRALELARGLPDSREVDGLHAKACVRLLFAGWRVGLEDEEAASVYEEGRAVAERHGDTRHQIELASAYALMQNFQGDIGGQFATLNEALGLLTPDSDPSVVASIHQRMGWTHMLAGNLREALEHSDRGLEACGEGGRNAGQVGGYSDYGYLRIQRGLTLGYMGRFEEARDEIELGLALAEEMSDPVIESNGLGYAGTVACMTGDAERGVALARRGFEKARELGEPIWIWGTSIYLSSALLENRSWQAAAEACEEADRQVHAAGFDQTVYVIINHAVARAKLGHRERARELVELAEARLDARHEPLTPLLELRLVRTRFALEGPATQSDYDADLEVIAERARATEHLPVLADIACERAARARARGDRETWRRWLGEARALHRELGADAWVQRITRELNEEG